jgi:hypothetical protein
VGTLVTQLNHRYVRKSELINGYKYFIKVEISYITNVSIQLITI